MFLTNMLGANIFATIALVFNYIGGIVIGIFKFLLFMPMYLIFAGVMMIATFAEMTFKKLAGIDTIYLNGEAFGGGSGDGKDLVYAFITDSAVQDVFWSIIGLSIILLFIFTIVAMIKSEFTIDLKGSAKGPIISRALKSLVNLLVVPVVTLISIFGTNFLTTTIYDLFTPEGTSVVTKCFHVGAYNANRVRCDEDFPNVLRNTGLIATGNPFASISNDDDMANAIDDYFMKYQDINIVYQNYNFIDLLEAVDDGELTEGSIDALFFGFPKNQTFFTLFRMAQVNIYYDLAKFDWILAIGSGIVITWTLLSVCLVLVKRVFELCILFLLAPPMTAIAPLDGGQAEKKWRGEFMKRLLSVIAPIFAYNMYFLLIPLFENISLFEGFKMAVGTGTGISSGVSMLGSYQLAITDFLFIFNIFFQLICIIVGLGILKSASALLSNLLGVEDLVKSGGEAAKKAVDVGKKAALGATAIGGMAVKGAATAIKGAKAIKDGIKNKNSEGGKSAADAKKQLGKAEDEAEAADKDLAEKNAAVTEAEEKVQSSAAYKKQTATIEDLERQKADAGGILGDKEQKQLQDAYIARGKLISENKDVKDARDAQQKAKQTSEAKQKALDNRKSGISEDMEKTLNRLDDGRDEKGRFLSKEKAKEARERANTIREQASKGGVGEHLKAAYDSEFGEDAGTTSVAAKASTWINDKTKKWAQKHTLLSQMPILNNIPNLTNSLQEQFAISGDTAKRRMNDGLAGMFGEGGGGDLWKIWFNKNARAALYEGVPESKTRSANIEQSLSWGARDKWEKDNRAKQEKEETLQLIRRMLARDKGGDFAKNYENTYKKLENETNPAQIKSLKAKIEKMEIEEGISSAARSYYDGLTPGSAKAAALAKFKDEMQADANKKELEKKASAEQKTLQANIQTGSAPLETKITERSAEQVARAIAQQLGSGRGIKLSNEKGAIKIEGLAETLAGVTEGINSLSVALKVLSEMSGKTGSDAGGNKPDK